MAKCAKCGAEIAGTGGQDITWKIYCRKCFPRIKDIVEQILKDLEEEKKEKLRRGL